MCFENLITVENPCSLLHCYQGLKNMMHSIFPCCCRETKPDVLHQFVNTVENEVKQVRKIVKFRL